MWIGRDGMGLRWHWECGRHSGIPACCRVWWLTVWQVLHPFMRWWQNGDPEHFYHRWSEGWGYVPCPGCIVRGRVNVVKSCNCG